MRNLFTKLSMTVGLLALSLFAEAQLSGTYTVDPSGNGDYSSVSAAANDLRSKGVNGAVTINIKDATYNGQVSLRAISGASSSNTITFRGNTSDSTKVKIRNGGSYVLYMYGCDYVKFEHVTIEHTSSSGYAIYLNSNATYNSFESCKIHNTSTSGSPYLVYNYNNSGNSWNMCAFREGYMGMYNYGTSTSSPTKYLTITNNTFIGQQYYAIYSYRFADVLVEGNYVDSVDNGGDGYSMYMYYGQRNKVNNNRFFGSNIYWGYENYYASGSDSSQCINNLWTHDGGYYGAYLYRQYRNRIMHNSWNFTNAQNYGAYMYYPLGSEIVNNNMHMEGGTYGLYMYNRPKSMDYNNLDLSGGSAYAYFGYSTYTSFNSMNNSNSGFHNNSMDVDPEFEDGYNNPRSFSANLNNSGLAINWAPLKKDCDGNPRPNSKDSKVDIGANDYYLSPYDLDVKEIVSPESVKPYSSNKITAILKNAGSATLTNQYITLHYSVDSGKTYSVSQKDTITSLKPGDSYSFTFNTTWNPGRTGDFGIVVKIDNSVSNDPDLVDSLYADRCSGLAGTYTIGSSANADFPDLKTAMAKLSCGLAGALTFEFEAGTYSAPLHFNSVNATPSTPLIFDGVNRDSVTVQYSGTDGVVEMNNSSYITVKNMTLEQRNTQGFGVHVSNGAHNNVVENCDIKTNNSSYYTSSGIALVGSSYSSQTKVDSNRFENNNITGFYYGVNSRSSNSSRSYNNTFKNNNISSYYYYGMYNYYQQGVICDGNKIVNPRYQYNYPFYWYYSGENTIINNVIGDYYVYQLYMYRENYYSQSKSTLLQNNIFQGESSYTSTTYGYGTYIYYAYNLQVYHNTFTYQCKTVPSSASGTGTGAAFKIYYSYDLDIQNNIFLTPHNTSGTVPIFLYNIYSWVAMEGNNLVHPGGIVANINGSNVSSLANLQSTLSGLNSKVYSEPVYFKSANDYHLSTTKRNLRGTNIGITSDIDGDQRCVFAPSVGADESDYPEPKPTAFFAVDDTVWRNSPYTLFNSASKSASLEHQWYVNGQYISSVVDLPWKFTNMGYDTIKLVSQGCGGIDSFEKYIYVDTPKVAPDAIFIASETTVNVNGELTFRNLSENGPDTFSWDITPKFYLDYGFWLPAFEYVNGTDSTSANPEVVFYAPGSYSVSLTAKNNIGSDTETKTNYISVRDKQNLCLAIDESNYLAGALYDDGGPNGGYGTNQNCNFLIDPCTDELTLTFENFSLSSGSYLRIYDGKDNSGKPLHAYDASYSSGLTGSIADATFQKTLVAKSGKAYIEFQSGGTSNSGFEMVWQGRKVNITAPTAGFSIPDTVCVDAPFSIQNTTTGLDVDYEWYMDTAGFLFAPDYETKEVTHSYDFAGTYYIQMTAKNCTARDSIVKAITVVQPNAAPTANFGVSVQRPSIGDPVTFTDMSSFTGGFECVSGWKWSFKPASYAFADGSSATSQNPVVSFSDTGCFEATLIVSNGYSSDTFVNSCAVTVISTCVPSIKYINDDIGISRVVVGDIDNSSAMADNDGYSNYVGTHATDLQIGGSYDITIERAGSRQNDMNRAVWIDYNQDGDFQANEKVASSGGDKNASWTAQFRVPKTALQGPTRLRVGVNLGSKANLACGPNQFGEYEDYRVNITPDTEAPEVIILGGDNITIEQCSAWVDMGAYGMDNVDDSVGISNTQSTLDVSKAGTYEIVYTAKDLSGNEGTGVRKVTVTADATNPVITLISGSSIDHDVNTTFTDPGYMIMDNCTDSATLYGAIKVSGSVNTSVVAAYTLTYEVTDNGGNDTMVTRTVNVVDRIAPSITAVNGGDTVYVEVYTSYTEQGVTASDNYYSASQLTTIIGGDEVDVNTLGTYEVTYRVVDGSSNTSTEATRTVIVRDATKPSIELVNTDTVTLDVNTAYEVEGANVSDNYSSDAYLKTTYAYSGSYVDEFGADGNATKLGLYAYVYTITDENGNSDSATRWINVVDRIAPEITLVDDDVIYWERWTDFSDPGASATDNYDATSAIDLSETNTVDVQSNGIYTVTYTAVDQSGNSSTKTRTVIVTQTTSVGDVAEFGMEIFPNPSAGQFRLKVDLTETERLTVNVYDALGKVVYSSNAGMVDHYEGTINLTNLESGIYMVHVVTPTQKQVKMVQIRK